MHPERQLPGGRVVRHQLGPLAAQLDRKLLGAKRTHCSFIDPRQALLGMGNYRPRPTPRRCRGWLTHWMASPRMPLPVDYPFQSSSNKCQLPKHNLSWAEWVTLHLADAD